MSQPISPPGRAITPEAKRAVLDRIYEAWTTGKCTQLRLGQLLDVSIHSTGSVLFYIEDEVLAEAVQKMSEALAQ